MLTVICSEHHLITGTYTPLAHGAHEHVDRTIYVIYDVFWRTLYVDLAKIYIYIEDGFIYGLLRDGLDVYAVVSFDVNSALINERVCTYISQL